MQTGKQIRLRATGIFTGLILLIGVSASGSIYMGLKTHVYQQNVFTPLASVWENAKNSIAQSFVAGMEQEIETKTVQITPVQNRVNVNINTSTSGFTSGSNQKQNTQQQVIYTYPTFPPQPTFPPYPTAVPGQPGSKEWQDQFDKNWNDMNAKNAQMQKQVEQSQAQFCIDHPTLCK